jgi:hypothetical protein
MSLFSDYIGLFIIISIIIFIILVISVFISYGSKFPSKNVEFKLVEVKKGNMILLRPLVKRRFWGWSYFKIKQDGKSIICDKVQFHSKESAERYIDFYKKIKGVK